MISQGSAACSVHAVQGHAAMPAFPLHLTISRPTNCPHVPGIDQPCSSHSTDIRHMFIMATACKESERARIQPSNTGKTLKVRPCTACASMPIIRSAGTSSLRALLSRAYTLEAEGAYIATVQAVSRQTAPQTFCIRSSR